MKKTVVFFVLLLLFAFPVQGHELYDVSGMEDIEDAIPEETQDIFSSFGWNSENISQSLDTEGFFSLLGDFFKEGIKGVTGAALSVAALVILASLMNSFSQQQTNTAVDTVCMLSGAAVLITSVYSCIKASLQSLTGVFAFMSAAVPVYTGIMITSGKAATAAGTGGVILIACQVMSALCTFVVAPLMNGYLAVGMCSAFAGQSGVNSLMNTIRKCGMWLYSLFVSVFLFLLSAKGVTGSFTDNLTMKTAKFLLGTAVPVAGGALSESASAVAASISALKGSAGIYIIIAVFITVLPLICSLICWRFALLLTKNLSEIFSCNKMSALLSAGESVISLLLGFVLLSIALLIISMGVMIKI